MKYIILISIILLLQCKTIQKPTTYKNLTVKQQVIKLCRNHEKYAESESIRQAIRDLRIDIMHEIK
jgi:hypothetical protein